MSAPCGKCPHCAAPSHVPTDRREHSTKSPCIVLAGNPNCGKTSLFNALTGARQKVGNRPGVTVGKQWVTVARDVELLDTPGVLWPKFEDPAVGERLAFTGAVKDQVVDVELLAIRLLAWLHEEYPQLLLERYKLTPADTQDREDYELLELVGLGDKASAYPAQLSGGQQQRVAIARALATNPKVLLCDEATSALDPKTTNAILELIREINQKLGITVIIITHQMSVVESTCRHVAILEEGQVVEQGEVSAVFSHPKSEAARRLVFPEGNPESLLCSLPGSRLIRVVFNGADATGKHIIARMATEIGVEANIAYASTRSIEGRAYGSMLLSIEDKNDDLARAICYLTQDGDITAQEVTQYAE